MNHESEWTRWPIAWSAVWVGALTALAVGLIIGLIGFALGANEAAHYVDWKKMRLIGAIFSVGGAFFAAVAGGWTAARIAGIRRSEPAMLHGAISFLVTLPLLLALAGLGVAGHWGGWYGGLASIPAFNPSAAPDPDLARATRNNAVATAVALLLGLVGSVIGGWMASGEPMTFTHYKTRDRLVEPRATAAPSARDLR
jgi:MFS family permease